MAVAFGSAGFYLTFGTHAGTTLFPPASIADGDLLIAYIVVGLNNTDVAITPPAGWTAIPGSPTTAIGGVFHCRYNIFYKIAASESGNYVFAHTSCSSCGLVVRYTGVDTVSPFSPMPTTNTGTGATATATGFTTTVADTFVIFTEHDFGDNSNDTVAPAGTTPSFNERLDSPLILYIADGTLATPGATGDKSHTCNNITGSPWAAYLIGLMPAGGGAVSTTLNANPSSGYALTGATATLAYWQIINIGAIPNDRTGDQLRSAFDKCNQNFSDLYQKVQSLL